MSHTNPGMMSVLGGVIMRPQATFERLRDGARSYWWMVLIIASFGLVLLNIGEFLATQNSAAAISETMAQTEGAPVVTAGSIRTFRIIGTIVGMVTGIGGLAIGYLLLAGIVYGLSLALGGRSSFKQVFQMSVWTRLPDAIRTILQSVAVFVSGNVSARGLSGALSPQEALDMHVLDTLLGRIDLYLIWGFLLLAIGTSVTTRVSKGKGFLISLIYFVISVGVAVAFAGIIGAVAGRIGPR